MGAGLTQALDCRIGVGLRKEHYAYLLEKPRTAVRWFEVISENYMDSGGQHTAWLETIRRENPIALHGVSMSIASVEGFRPEYLARLRALADRIDPFIVSDHLCWTGTAEGNSHDLLPVPRTKEALDLVVRRIRQVQDALGSRMFAIENVSSYIDFPGADYPEWDFLVEVARRSGCKILLDVNNVYVNSRNHTFDPYEFLDAVPTELIGQVHLAGHTEAAGFVIDTHSKPVAGPVWDLFSHLARRLENVPVMIEWDLDIPGFPVLEAEAMKAASVWKRSHEEKKPVGRAAGRVLPVRP